MKNAGFNVFLSLSATGVFKVLFKGNSVLEDIPLGLDSFLGLINRSKTFISTIKHVTRKQKQRMLVDFKEEFHLPTELALLRKIYLADLAPNRRITLTFPACSANSL